MTALPPDIEPTDEVQVKWTRDDIGTKVEISLGEVSVNLQTSHESAETLPWVVAALPSILEAAWAAIEAEESEEA